VLDDEADVAAVGINTWQNLTAAGDDTVSDLEVVWQSEHYNHCNFTALDSFDPYLAEAWVTTLLAMDWEDPMHRRILELEGLRKWERAELSGYRSLIEAMDEQGISDHW
jgi:ABC-type phosphate/phosphonate transport system substrate-binding protein